MTRPFCPAQPTRWILTCLAALGLTTAAWAQTGDDQLQRRFRDYLDKYLALRPLDATRLGDHRYDAQLDDLSVPARRGWAEFTRSTLRDLPKQVDVRRLSPDGRIDFEIWRQDLTKSLWLTEQTRPFEEDPRVYNEYLSDSVYLVLAQSTLPKETNIANALTRIAQIPRIVTAAKQNLRHPPKPILETAILQNRGSIAFYEGDILQFVGDSPQRDAVKAAGARAAGTLKEYQAWLETDLMPRATGDWRLGKRRFDRKFELEMDAGLTADQALAEAQAEYRLVIEQMYVVARQLWSRYFLKQPLPPDDGAGRRETVARVLRQVAQEHGDGDGLLKDVRATVAEVKRFIREVDFLRLPEPDRCQIIEMPEFQRGNSVAYLNAAPPLDPAAPSFYAVSPPPAEWSPARTRSYLEEYNRYMLQILTIHEAYPGHYVQLEYSNRAHSPIRRVLQSGPFIEGWAVYTEKTMLDLGYGEGNLPLRLTQLKFYLRAVVNAMLDHEMHCTRMSDTEALKLLVEGAFQSEEEAKLKIIRAKQSSVQLSTYFVGRMAMQRLRNRVQMEMGERFELGRFHEALLDHGSVPLKYLPELAHQRLQLPR